MTGSPQISLVIPTRERASTLAHTLRSALLQDSSDFEVLVSDNVSQDDTRQVVEAVRDPRVRLLTTERRLSMCDNWEFALQHVRGRYVIFIGDDDAVLPHGIDRLLQAMRDRPVPIYTWSTPIYRWPIDGKGAGLVYLPPVPEPHDVDIRAKARFVATHGGWRFHELAGVYHSAIARELLDRIRDRVGRVFASTQPDVFTALVLPAFEPRARHIGRPVSLNGVSSKSNGGSMFSKGGREVFEKYIREFEAYRVHPTLYSGINPLLPMTGDTVLLAVDHFPELFQGAPFDYTANWAYLYKIKQVSRAQVLAHRREIRKMHPLSLMRFLFYCSVFDAALVRRKLIDAVAFRRAEYRNLPSNVCDFAKVYADSLSRGA